MTEPRDDGEEESEPSPLGTPKELLGLFSRAAMRQRRLTLTVLASALVLTTAIAFAVPKVWDSSSKILVQRSSMQMLSNPRSNVQVDAPADIIQTAPNIILKRDNLVAVIDELSLWERWTSTRPRLFRVKDRVVEALSGPLNEDARRRALVALLEKKITVAPEDGAAFRIRVEWQDAETAFAIATAIEKRFLADKVAAETSLTSEAIVILEDEVKRSATGINTALAELVKVSDKVVNAHAPTTAPLPQAPTPVAKTPAKPADSAAVPATPPVDVAALLADKQTAIRALRDPWRQKIAALEAQKESLRATYTEAHPQVVEVESKLATARVKPPELATLEVEERQLLDRVAAHGTIGDKATPPPRPTPRPLGAVTPLAPAAPAQLMWDGSKLAVNEAPEVVAARERLISATTKYEDALGRLDTARVQLQSVQAAFKYRFIVLQPAEIPRKPLKPNRALLVLGAIVASALLAFLTAGVRALLRGRFIEPWQVSRRLRLPLLGEVEVDYRPPSA